MKTLLKLKHDSHNSSPEGELEVHVNCNNVILKLTDTDREVSVNRHELLHALTLPGGESNE